MIIKIQTTSHKMVIPIPNAIAFSRLGYSIVNKRLALSISYELYKTIGKCIKRYKNLTVLEVDTKEAIIIIRI